MPFVYPFEVRTAAVELVRSGRRPVDVAAELGVSSTSVYTWLHAAAPELIRRAEPCFRCGPPPSGPPDRGIYAYLLGVYLGDGWIHQDARGIWRLSLYCADAWPGLIDAAETAARTISGRRPVKAPKPGCTEVKTFWNHWPCVFPQHGPGRKHERAIVLAPWQADVVAEQPGSLLRGLFHSDGWRGRTWRCATQQRASSATAIRGTSSRTRARTSVGSALTLDSLAIAWRPVGPWRIAVSRREAVAALDEHVGPKY